MEDYKDFRDSIKKVSDSRTHKVRNSLGIYDGYKYYRKTKPPQSKYILSESQYFAITRRVNNLLAEVIINGGEITFPHRMGRLEIRKNNREIKIGKDGEIITNLPINWDATLRLWFESEEEYSKKTLIRVEENEIFKVYYNRSKATFNNKSYYQFNVNRDLKKRLKQKIKDGRIDAMYLDKNKRYE